MFPPRMRFLKAKDLQPKVVLMYHNQVYFVFKTTLFVSDKGSDLVEVETENFGTGLLIFKAEEPVLVMGVVE